MTREQFYEVVSDSNGWVLMSYSELARDQIIDVVYPQGQEGRAQVVRTVKEKEGVFIIHVRPL